MAISISHLFVSAIPDDPAAVLAGEVVPSNWNAAHALSGGTSGSVLFIDGGGNFAQDNANLFWNASLKDLHIGGAYYVGASRALYLVPNVTENNWFEGNAGNQTVTGYGNFGTGDNALSSLTTGFDNTAVGTNALKDLTTGSSNFG